MNTTAIVLAAGRSTRMNSKKPKVLHPLMGRPMAFYALEAAGQASGAKPVAVIGHESEMVRQALGDKAEYVIQEPQLGTGHAVRQAEALLKERSEYILVTTADMPLLTGETLKQLVQAQQAHSGPMTLLTATTEEARGFGRVLRDAAGRIQAVIEEAHATPGQLAIRELNTSVYCFSAEWLWQTLPRIPLSPKGEYYLTDLVGIAAADGLSIQTIDISDPGETIGVNTRLHLAEAEALLRQRINREWMLAGVTMIDPQSTYIETGVSIGQDTVLWPNTYLQGNTSVGEDCTIGPNAIIRDTQIGNGCRVLASVLERAVVEDRVDIGPFGHLRKGAHLAEDVHMGNFGEVKNSYLGPGSKLGHFSYIGDATIGSNVNIGAGTITCNFDGKQKHHTDIGANVFIGSDTMLVAPVKIGEGARTGAGAVVTKDLPDYTLAVGIPARAIRKLERSD
jgi:bifunctional UDP-N-acetylglucosamine pyrophosphorylase / glucosamine-1-phosphate N-acetyltransferase